MSVAPVDVAFTMQQGWNFPAVSRAELAASFDLLREQVLTEIKSVQPGSIDTVAADLNLLADRANFIRANVLPQIPGNTALAIAVVLSFVEAVRSRVYTLQNIRTRTIAKPEDISKDVAAIKKMRADIRAGEGILRDVQPRIGTLKDTVDGILAAQTAMAQLPDDIASLGEKREQVEEMASAVLKMRTEGERALADLLGKIKTQEELQDRAEKTLDRADAAYRANTSQGLASAFKERADSLTWTVWYWVAGLIAALGTGGFLGYLQLDRLTTLIDKAAASPGQGGATLWVDFVLSILSIGGPFWFAWVSTKQIGQRFKLAEDYGYKASISKAYEGYRQEAVRLDPDFQSRLFASALTRLEESPLRVMDEANHGSPWHALLDSDVIRQALSTVPSFANQVVQLAKDALPAVKDEAKNLVQDAAQKVKSVANDAVASTESEKA